MAQHSEPIPGGLDSPMESQAGAEGWSTGPVCSPSPPS